MPQHEIFGRVAGEHHLGEGHEVCAALGGMLRPSDDELRVTVEVTDYRVDLGEGKAELWHVISLSRRPGT